MSTKRVTALEQIAWVDWRRLCEAEVYRAGLGPMPPEKFGDPQWLRELRAKQKEAAK